MRARPKFPRIVTAALRSVAMYPRHAVLLAGTAAFVLAAALPITLLAGGSLGPRLAFSTVRGAGLGLTWAGAAQSPAVTQAHAVAGLADVLLLAAFATLAVGALTILALTGARAGTRDIEIAVGRATGASRRLLLHTTLLEGTAIAAAALLAAGILGILGNRFVLADWPGTAHPEHAGISLVTGAIIAALIVAGTTFPALFARRTRVVEIAPKPLTLWIPAAQLGLCLSVLSAGMIIRQQAGSSTGVAGATATRGDVFQLAAPELQASARAAAYARILAALSRNPAIELASLTSPGAIVGLGTVAPVTTDCGRCSDGGLQLPWHVRLATHQLVSADSFRALGVRLVEGRTISRADTLGAEPVAVVSTALAAQHFQDGHAVGRRIRTGVGEREWYRVVGIAESPPAAGFRAALQPAYTVYLSVLQHPGTATDLLVTGPPSGARLAAVASTMHLLGTRSRVHRERSAVVASERGPVSWLARWLAFEGIAMMVLAGGGTFVLMRAWVRSLFGELGLRRALGARRRDVLGSILVRAAAAGVGGAGFGVWAGPAVWDAVRVVVSGLPAWDPGVVVRLAMVLVMTAVAGALVPGIAAARAAPASLIEATGD